MKITRFINGGKIYHGRPIDARRAHVIDGDLLSDFRVSDRVLEMEKLLAPIVPIDILCIGVNYGKHAAESGIETPPHPLLFIKAGNTLNNPGDPIPFPKLSVQIDFEGELAVIIGKPARDVSREKALDCVFGYTVANDVTARDWQRDKALGGGQFARGKSFDGFCPLGPWIVTRDEIQSPNRLRLRTTINGQTMQDESTAAMIFDVPTLIADLSTTMTLRPGVIILTGTPSGVGMGRKPPVWMKPGDVVAVEIEGIGRLENRVAGN